MTSEIEITLRFMECHGAEWRYVDNPNWRRNRAAHGWHRLEGGKWRRDATLEIFDTIRKFISNHTTDPRHLRWATVRAVEGKTPPQRTEGT